MKGFEQEILAAGCTGYVTKPIDIDVLLGMLAEKLGGRRAQVPAAATPPAATPAAIPVLDERVPVAAATGGTSRATPAVDRPPIGSPAGSPVVSRFAKHPRLKTAARRFAARLDEQLHAMERAHAESNFVELTALAHWLKGAGGTVGYDDFTAPARNLETLAKAGDAPGTTAVLAELRDLAARLEVPPEHDARAA